MDVDKLLRDAAEHGLANVKEVKRFFENKRDATVDRFFKAWSDNKQHLFQRIDEYLGEPSAENRKKVEAAYREFDQAVEPANTEFISMVVDRYRDILEGS